MNVLYFTVVPLGTATNGGSLCCRNHVRRLASDSSIHVIAMVAGHQSEKAATEIFLSSLGVKCYYQPFREGNIRHSTNKIKSVLQFAEKCVFQFPWELQALNQPHIEEGIAWAIKGYNIDILIVDYHQSALFIDLPRNDVKTVLIGLNREADFYQEQMRLGQIHHGSLTAFISLARLRRWERHVNSAVDQVVTIGVQDQPKGRIRRPPISITPYLDAPGQQWSYSNTRRIFFVGAFGHYPNRLAIEWLIRAFAPALLLLDPSIRITIVGASDQDIPEGDACTNVELLGFSDSQTVSTLFQTSDLMICPIQNDFGVKFKSLEALAYGTPLLASEETLLGIPHIRDTAKIDLDNPSEAARIACDLICNPEQLIVAQRRQWEIQSSFINDSVDIWSKKLKSLLIKST